MSSFFGEELDGGPIMTFGDDEVSFFCRFGEGCSLTDRMVFFIRIGEKNDIKIPCHWIIDEEMLGDRLGRSLHVGHMGSL